MTKMLFSSYRAENCASLEEDPLISAMFNGFTGVLRLRVEKKGGTFKRVVLGSNPAKTRILAKKSGRTGLKLEHQLRKPALYQLKIVFTALRTPHDLYPGKIRVLGIFLKKIMTNTES